MTLKGKFRLAVVDRAGLSVEFEAIARERSWPIEVSACSSALEVIGEGAPREIGGLAVGLSASGPFLADLLRWTETDADKRVPTLVVGAGTEQDEPAARSILNREHVAWADPNPKPSVLSEWLLSAIEVHELRAFRAEHDRIAASLREARMQLFRGFIASHTPPEGPPCGPALPTRVEEIVPLRDARMQFERSHIQAAVREWGSLKDASGALGISYTSLWRRLR